MGFSWAFHLAQECLRSLVSRALVIPRFITDFHPAPDLTTGNAVLVYADSGGHFGLCRESVDKDRQEVENILNKHGLVTHEVQEASTVMDILGTHLDGASLEFGPTAHRLGKLRAALGPLLRGSPVTGKDLEHIVGHIITILLVNRLALSFLGHVYDFIKGSNLRKQPLWKSVREELRQIRAILPLCRVSLEDEVVPFLAIRCVRIGLRGGPWHAALGPREEDCDSPGALAIQAKRSARSSCTRTGAGA